MCIHGWAECDLLRQRSFWHDRKICTPVNAKYNAAAACQDQLADLVAAGSSTAVELALNQHLQRT
jgi:hypothetical protein